MAGHETTSTAVTYALFALTQHPDVQRKLRDELLAVSTEEPGMDELQALPYLDLVVREVLRFYAPAPISIRAAANDDEIPLATPIVDRNGKLRHSIPYVLWLCYVYICSCDFVELARTTFCSYLLVL